MIVGVGIDLVSLPDFAQQLQQPGSAFVSLTFTERERSDCGAAATRTQRLGARFAAKEAFIKAWSGARLGFGPDLSPAAVDFREIEVRHDDYGRPFLGLHGTVRNRVTQSLGAVDAQLSMSHEPELATAIVTLTQLADSNEAASPSGNQKGRTSRRETPIRPRTS